MLLVEADGLVILPEYDRAHKQSNSSADPYMAAERWRQTQVAPSIGITSKRHSSNIGSAFRPAKQQGLLPTNINKLICVRDDPRACQLAVRR